jgi:hypothetical protein
MNTKPGPIRRKRLEVPFYNYHILQIHCLVAPKDRKSGQYELESQIYQRRWKIDAVLYPKH